MQFWPLDSQGVSSSPCLNPLLQYPCLMITHSFVWTAPVIETLFLKRQFTFWTILNFTNSYNFTHSYNESKFSWSSHLKTVAPHGRNSNITLGAFSDISFSHSSASSSDLPFFPFIFACYFIHLISELKRWKFWVTYKWTIMIVSHKKLYATQPSQHSEKHK